MSEWHIAPDCGVHAGATSRSLMRCSMGDAPRRSDGFLRRGVMLYTDAFSRSPRRSGRSGGCAVPRSSMCGRGVPGEFVSAHYPERSCRANRQCGQALGTHSAGARLVDGSETRRSSRARAVTCPRILRPASHPLEGSTALDAVTVPAPDLGGQTPRAVDRARSSPAVGLAHPGRVRGGGVLVGLRRNAAGSAAAGPPRRVPAVGDAQSPRESSPVF